MHCGDNRKMMIIKPIIRYDIRYSSQDSQSKTTECRRKERKSDTIYDTAAKIYKVKQENADAKKENRHIVLQQDEEERDGRTKFTEGNKFIRAKER